MHPFVEPERDVHTAPNENTFKMIKKELIAMKEYTSMNGLKPLQTLIFVDDLAGLNIIHGGRISAFANLAVQVRHFDTSIISIAQQFTAITPAFRDNCGAVIAFPSNRHQDKDFIKKEYCNTHFPPRVMDEIIETAWKQMKPLFIIANARQELRYFIDFYHEIKPQ
jgi:hypothetical protein